LCVTVVQSHSSSLKLVPNGEARMQITVIVHYCDAIYIFCRFRNITNDVSRVTRGLAIRRAKKRVNLTNHKRIKMCLQRFDSHAYTRLQFLRAVSHAVGSEKMLSESHSDADDDDTQHQNDDDTSDDSGTPTTVSADAAVDFCEMCLVAPRDTRIALVPCGHQRFCESCANEVHNQGRGCPLCRTPINMLLRLY